MLVISQAPQGTIFYYIKLVYHSLSFYWMSKKKITLGKKMTAKNEDIEDVRYKDILSTLI